MKRVLLLLALAALVFPGGATAKGPSAATIDGPGTGGGIDVTGTLEPGSPLIELSEGTGFFSAVFRQTPDPMLVDRPEGTLGPKYTITYTVPGPEGETFVLRQDLYPYASPTPVTYMEPGQKVFRITTHGGWFVAGPKLKDWLVAVGLPASPPSGSAADDSAFFLSAELMTAIAAAALLLGAGCLIFLRRRERPAAAA